jgi:methylenetetrahydrofolate reductase (NADPH)
VYQKAYIEFFCSKPILEKLIEKCKSKHSSISLYAINVEGDEKCITSSSSKKGVTALTWGVFPEMEIMQPTIFDRNSFAVWSKEAFQLWIDSWASLYDDESPSAELIYNIFDTYYLVALVDNDFINPTILDIFTSEF